MADENKEEQTDEEQDEYVSMDQVMDELDVGKDDLEEMVSQGELQAYTSGDEMKFREDEISSLKEKSDDRGNGDQEGGEEEFLTMDQVMGKLGVDKDDLEQMVSQGKLRAYRSDNKMKFREEDVFSLEESGRHKAIMDSDEHEQMEDIGDAIDQDVSGAQEEEELDLEDIEVDDEEIDELASDLMLEEEEGEEEKEEEEEGGEEEMIFEEEELSAGPEEMGDEEIDLDAEEPLLDDDETSDLSLDEDEQEADTGKTIQMDSDAAGKTLQDEDVDAGSDTQRRRTTRRRTTQTADRTRTAVATQTAIGKIWMAVLIIGVIIALEGLLIGVDMARVSTMSNPNEQIQPWATSAPAEFMLNLTSDRSMNPEGNTNVTNTTGESTSGNE